MNFVFFLNLVYLKNFAFSVVIFSISTGFRVDPGIGEYCEICVLLIVRGFDLKNKGHDCFLIYMVWNLEF